MLKKLLVQIMLSSEPDAVSVEDRLKYAALSIAKIAPFAYILDFVDMWFKSNHQFFFFVMVALLGNMLIGAWRHHKAKSFDFTEFLTKNATMGFIIVITYVMLETLRYTAGENIAGETFRVLIQVMTLLYPVSKAVKNIFILSRGQYPPEFLMRRLYSFERNGDLADFFSSSKTDTAEGFDDFKTDLLTPKTKKDE